MGGMMNGLGAALSGYARDRFGNIFDPSKAVPGHMKNGGIIGAIGQGMARYRAAQQQASGSPANQMDMSPVTGALPPQSQPVGASDETGGGAEPLGMDTFGEGQLVTRPTIALLGDKGAERVVPLNNNPMNKVNSPSVIPRYRGAEQQR